MPKNTQKLTHESLRADDARTGFRFQRLEVLNWGTFHQQVWHIEPQGWTSLLTGDIGSGKSTLVDAITTLFVPYQQVTYNKAAGAQGNERTLRSYIKGEYKTEKDEFSQTAKSVALRDEQAFSVVLGYFYNEGYAEHVTLAQVFWLKHDKPEKFFLVASDELTIADCFSHFTSIRELKKKLKSTASIKVFETFNAYSAKFRQSFGIRSKRALDLFYQTVSMKSVGNFTDFVRHQMLEKPNVRQKIEQLLKSFEDVTEAHNAVQKAKEQLALLMPLLEDAAEYEALATEEQQLKRLLNALPCYFARRKADILQQELQRIAQRLSLLAEQLAELADDIKQLRQKHNSLNVEYHVRGGQRIKDIETAIDRLEEIKKDKQKKAQEFQTLRTALKLSAANSEKAFYRLLEQAKALHLRNVTQLDEVKIQHRNTEIKFLQTQAQYTREEAEFTSLKQRKTRIKKASLDIRDIICDGLDIAEEELPFIAELLQVADDQKDWEAAIERLLNNFGRSLLVPERHYKRVNAFVNKTDLKGRLVYYRIPRRLNAPSRALAPNSLIEKLNIKPDTPFVAWMQTELEKRLGMIVCCETMAEFHKQPDAITREGLIKRGNSRHEKDDRGNLRDKRRYILGWSNIETMKAIRQELQRLKAQLAQFQNTLTGLDDRERALAAQNLHIHDLQKFEAFADIYWQKEAKEIQALSEERDALENKSDVLQTLERQLTDVAAAIAEAETTQARKQAQKSKQEVFRETYTLSLKECRQEVEQLPLEEQDVCFPQIEARLPEAQPLAIRTIGGVQKNVATKIQKRIAKVEEEEGALRDRVIGKMQAYKSEYPAETIDVDASVGSIAEFKQFARYIQQEGLPDHEQRFKQLLRERTIEGLALFSNQLEIFEKDIQQNVRKINESLAEIDYEAGKYIKLLDERSSDVEIREFKTELRNCLENTLGETDLYSERKFFQVKSILDRFSSGEPEDRSWTEKVTDVRNWYMFHVSVRWKADDTEYEYVKDTAGKSGGQKEKLAYTILASALACHFGLEWGVAKSRSFRFVVIDEAFGRGSDESTRYALELFKKLKLQLLIVTPLQKIHVIEEFIHAVHFVSNQKGNNSVVENMSITQYHDKKAEYLEAQGS